MCADTVRGIRWPRFFWVAALACAALASAPSQAAAQSAATITGRVLDERTGAPLPNARVVLVGTTRTTVTDSRGSYRFETVTPGARQVQASRIGFSAATRAVTLSEGATVELDFRLGASAVSLDELVVSGRGASTARREIGTSVSTINAAELENAPVSSVSQLIQSRVPGATVLPAGGNVGQGSFIQLRGPGSLTQSTQPIIYVDGIRIDNSVYGTSGGFGPSGIDDINPDDIERVEIIKGAAAATLYGSEASGGVIQIFTKQGRGEAQNWNVSASHSVLNTPRDYWDVSVYTPYFYDTWVDNGRTDNVNASVRGSVDRFGYKVNGSYRNSDGMLPQSAETFGSFSAALNFTPSSAFNLNVTSGYNRRINDIPQGGVSTGAYGIAYNALVGGPHFAPTAGALPENVARFQNQYTNGRFNAGVRLEFVPRANFSQRFFVGLDAVNGDNVDFLPYRSGIFDRRRTFRESATTLSVDYNITYGTPLTERIRSRTSGAFQAYSKRFGTLVVNCTSQAGPVETCDAFPSATGSESRSEEKSAGFSAEQQFGLDERLFVTVGGRADAHSAFGSNVSYKLYPKADVSYLVSTHDWWPNGLGTLRLRGAYGTAGRQPRSFSALQTYRTFSALTGQPAISTNSIGNPNLEPELTRELEGGADLGLFNERVNVEVTAYNQRTTGALYNIIFPASQGFLASQPFNVATISNRGLEVGVTGAIVRRANLGWNARAGFSTNRNRVEDLGTQAPVVVSGLQEIREGYPIGSFFGDRHIVKGDTAILASVLLRDAAGNLPDGWDFLGAPLPTRNLNIGTDVTLRRRLTLGFLADYKGGHKLQSGTSASITSRVVTRTDTVVYGGRTQIIAAGTPVARWCQGIFDANAAARIPDPQTRAMCRALPGEARGNHVYDAASWHLREVSASYRLPSGLTAPLGVRTGTLTLAGRNLWRQQDYRGIEADANSVVESRAKQTFFDTPLPRTVVATFSVDF